jgi:hypothetical protein
LSAPKKGKDLSALKARLAKKAAEPEGAGPAPADVPAPGEARAAVPAPGEVQKPSAGIPAPGEVKKPMDIPAPGEVLKPADIPAPGEVSRPIEQPVETGPKSLGDDPMSGGAAFNPDAGLIDDVGADIKPRGSAGLAIFAGVIGIVVGAGLGWMAHKASEGRTRVDSARKKAKVIQERVEEIEETRAKISLAFGEAQEALEAKDPDKAMAILGDLEPNYVELGDLFGWQLAAMDPKVIKAIMSLADDSNRLQFDVSLLASWVSLNKEILSNRVKGPSSFVVVGTPAGGVVLAELVAAICGEVPEEIPEDFNLDTLTRCEADGGLEAIVGAPAFLIRTQIGGETTLVPSSQAMYLVPDGQVYSYAIGANPDANAKTFFDLRMGKLDDDMGRMVKHKDEALAGIKHYVDNPSLGD